MYKFLLAISLLLGSITFSQDSTSTVRWEDTSATKKALDNAQHFLDSMKNAEFYKQTTQGLNNFLQYQKEQKTKQKKKAILYIGLGVFFLAIMIIGLVRRSKLAKGK